MYGIPKDLKLARLIGHEFDCIGLARFQIQFHISGVVSIDVQGAWELRDAVGEVLDQQLDPSLRDAYRVHRLIGVPISGFTLNAPDSFTLIFDTGHSLTIFDDSPQYESFAVHFVGEPSLRI